MNNQTLEDCPDIFGGGFGSDIEVNVGFIRQCYFNQIFDRVQEYDVYRYTHCSIGTCLLFSFIISVPHPHLHLSPPGVHTHLSSLSLFLPNRYALGIIICCMALLSVVLTLVGIALGVVGWRKDRSPDSRTRVSHCGGIVLLV